MRRIRLLVSWRAVEAARAPMANKLPKYANISFEAADVLPWAPHVTCSHEGFKCNRSDFRNFWKDGRVERDVRTHLCKCWTITHGDQPSLVAYITLQADELEVAHKLLSDESVPYRTFPAVKIGLLAADHRAKRSGTRLVDWALEYIATEIAPMIGVRFVTVDALYDPNDSNEPADATTFYQKFGFRFADPDEPLPPPQPHRTMYFDLKPLIEAIEAEGGE